MRLDHLLSKSEEVKVVSLLSYQVGSKKIFGGYAVRGNTRSHPEHDG